MSKRGHKHQHLQKSPSLPLRDEQTIEQDDTLPQLPEFWRAYETKLDGGVPSLTEQFVSRGNSAEGTFVSSVVEQLLAGATANKLLHSRNFLCP